MNSQGNWIRLTLASREKLFCVLVWGSTSAIPARWQWIEMFWSLRSAGCSRTKSTLTMSFIGLQICLAMCLRGMSQRSIGFCEGSVSDLIWRLSWAPENTTNPFKL